MGLQVVLHKDKSFLQIHYDGKLLGVVTVSNGNVTKRCKINAEFIEGVKLSIKRDEKHELPIKRLSSEGS